MARLRPGQPAPDLTVFTLDGDPMSLASTWGGGRDALLIFLRHLA